MAPTAPRCCRGATLRDERCGRRFVTCCYILLHTVTCGYILVCCFVLLHTARGVAADSLHVVTHGYIWLHIVTHGLQCYALLQISLNGFILLHVAPRGGWCGRRIVTYCYMLRHAAGGVGAESLHTVTCCATRRVVQARPALWVAVQPVGTLSPGYCAVPIVLTETACGGMPSSVFLSALAAGAAGFRGGGVKQLAAGC